MIKRTIGRGRRRNRRGSIVFLGIALAALVAASAFAQDTSSANALQTGIELYKRADFAGAESAFRGVLDSPSAGDEERSLAHLYLGIIANARGNADEARADFIESLRLRPERTLDSRRFSPTIVSAFEKAKADYLKQLAATDNVPPSIDHDPIQGRIPYGTEVSVSARVRDNDRVAAVQVNYRRTGEPAYGVALMKKMEGDLYEGFIPASATETEQLEYFITATDMAGNSNTAGRSNTPLLVEVEKKIETRSKTMAFLRSMAVPGLGQLYNEQPVKGYVFMGIEAGLVGTSLGFAVDGYLHQQEYEKDQPDTVDDYDKAEQSYLIASIGGGVAAGFWIYNMIDAWVCGPEPGKKKAARSWEVTPFAVPDGAGHLQVGIGLRITE